MSNVLGDDTMAEPAENTRRLRDQHSVERRAGTATLVPPRLRRSAQRPRPRPSAHVERTHTPDVDSRENRVAGV